MRDLIVSEFLTLDGVMQAPGDPNEDRDGGFDKGGWQLAFFDEVFGQTVMEGFAQTGALLLGRKTYEIFAAHWPHQPDDDPLARTMNELDKYVVSSSLEDASWANTTVISSEVPDQIRGLKGEDGGAIRIIGSGGLVRSLAPEQLIDRYELMIHPLVLGKGKRLFDGMAVERLELIDSVVTTTGVLMVTYRPAA